MFAAAIFAGSGQSRPLIVGLVLGALNAVFFIMFQVVFRQPIDPLIHYGQPFVHAALGAIAASIGGRIWQPAPALPALAAATGPGEEVLSIILPDQPEILALEPFPWVRVILGMVIAVGGTFGARWIRDFVVIAGGGSGHEMQSNFITWEITAVAQVVGGILAGANSRNGAIYGFWTGIFAAGLVIVIPALGASPTSEVSAWLLGSSSAESRPAALIVQGMQTLILGFLGGWLGALILPAHWPSRSLNSAIR